MKTAHNLRLSQLKAKFVSLYSTCGLSIQEKAKQFADATGASPSIYLQLEALHKNKEQLEDKLRATEGDFERLLLQIVKPNE